MKLHEISYDQITHRDRELYTQQEWSDTDIEWYIRMHLVGGVQGVAIENGVVTFAPQVYKTNNLGSFFEGIAKNMKKLPFTIADTTYSIRLDPLDGSLMLGTLEGFPKKADAVTINEAPYLFSLKGLPTRLTDLSISNLPITRYDAEGIVEETLHIADCLKLETLVGLPNSVTDITISNCPKITTLKGIVGTTEHLGLIKLHGLKSLAGCGSYLPSITTIEFDRIHLDDSILGLMEVKGLEKILYKNLSTDLSKAFNIINTHLGGDIFECQTALVEAGLERFAEL